jgi:WD40 repeat protein
MLLESANMATYVHLDVSSNSIHILNEYVFLRAAVSFDGQAVVTGAGNETLRSVFEKHIIEHDLKHYFYRLMESYEFGLCCERVNVCTAVSPDGQAIVTGAGDETLRFWSVFPGRAGGQGARSNQGGISHTRALIR